MHTYLCSVLSLLVWSSTCFADDVRLIRTPLLTGRTVSQYETWNQTSFSVKNDTPNEDEFLVTTYFDEVSEQQYARRLWLPAHSQRQGWMLVKTPSKASSGDLTEAMEMRTLVLQDQGYGETAVASDSGRRTHDHYIRCGEWSPKKLLITDPNSSDVMDYMDSMKTGNASGYHVQTDGEFPTSVDAYDGVTHIVLSTNRILTNPLAIDALKSWLFAGGDLWVHLDHVDEMILDHLLTDGGDISVVDELDLTSIRVTESEGSQLILDDTTIKTERPIRMLRVVHQGFDELVAVDGWPIVLEKSVGNGRMIVTTIDSRALFIQRTFKEKVRMLRPRSTKVGGSLGELFFGDGHRQTAEPINWPSVSASYIGYTVTRKSTVAWILLVFSSTLILSCVWCWRSGHFFRMTIISPVLASLATLTLLLLGSHSRGAIAPTEAMIQFAELDRKGNVLIQGGRSTYRTEAGQDHISLRENGWINHTSSLPGSAKRLVWSENGERSWENLDLPAGLQSSSLQIQKKMIPTVASFTLDERGLVGKLSGDSSREFTSGILVFPSGDRSSVRMNRQGQLLSQPSDMLASGQYSTDEVLDDRGQLRSELFQKLIAGTRQFPVEARLYFWKKPFDLAIDDFESSRQVGDALLSVPVQFQKPASENPFFLPKFFVHFNSVINPAGGISTVFNNRKRTWIESTSSLSDTTLRCSIPEVFAPFELSRINVILDLRIPGREVRIHAKRLDGSMELLKVFESPVGRQKIDIQSSELLHQDPDDILTLHIRVGAIQDVTSIEKNENNSSWKIEGVQFEGWAKSQ